MLQGGPEYAAEGPVIGACPTLFSPGYAPEEIYEIAAQLMKKGGISPLQPGDGLHPRYQGSPAGSPGAAAQNGRRTNGHAAKPTKSAKTKKH